jgi:hypothetical protein
MNHYHIRSADSKIDWQAFQTKDEAVALLKFLLSMITRPFGAACERCCLPPSGLLLERPAMDWKRLSRLGQFVRIWYSWTFPCREWMELRLLE